MIYYFILSHPNPNNTNNLQTPPTGRIIKSFFAIIPANQGSGVAVFDYDKSFSATGSPKRHLEQDYFWPRSK